MAKIFYDDLIAWKTLAVAVEALGLTKEEQLEFSEHLEHIIHTEVLAIIIEFLPPEKHEEFVERFHAAPHDEQHFFYIAKHAPAQNLSQFQDTIRRRSNEIIAELIAEFDEE
jgi:hypothetical protein